LLSAYAETFELKTENKMIFSRLRDFITYIALLFKLSIDIVSKILAVRLILHR